MKRKKIRQFARNKLDEITSKSFDEKEILKESPSRNLVEEIKKALQGLIYISETDAEILPFVGTTTEKVDREEIVKQTKAASDAPVEEKEFSAFFARLTEIQDWFGDEEKETARRYAALKEILEKNIRDLKVFKIGKIELDIYVAGLDSENTFLGIKTKSVET